MTDLVWAPPPPLAAFVARMWYSKAPLRAAGRVTAMADAAMGIIVPLGENRMSWWNGPNDAVHHQHHGLALIGAHTARLALDTSQLGELIGVQLRPGAAGAFFRPAAHELRDTHAPLEDLWGGAVARELHERLLEARSVREKFALLARGLLARLRSPVPDPAICRALAQIRRAPPEAVVRHFADQSGLSLKAFSARFAAHVGVTPKLYARIDRFRAVLAQVAAGRTVSWTQLALDLGYYDQSHFIRDFRAFTGLAPTEYDRQRGDQTEHVPLPAAGEIRTSRAA